MSKDLKLLLALSLTVGVPLASVGCGEKPGGAGETGSTGTATAEIEPDEPEEPAGDKKTSVDPAVAGGLKVMVKFAGEKIRNKNIKMGADPACESSHEQKAKEEKFIRNENMTMANVTVYLSGGPLKEYKFSAPKDAIKVDQLGCIYIPHVVSGMVKQGFDYWNSDDTLHNVHPIPKKNKEANIAMPFKGKKNTLKFKKEEVMFPVKCNVHPWMTGYVSVFKHPFHGVTPEGDGALTIEGIPAGEYDVMAAHEELGELTGKVTITAKQTAELTLEYK